MRCCISYEFIYTNVSNKVILFNIIYSLSFIYLFIVLKTSLKLTASINAVYNLKKILNKTL